MRIIKTTPENSGINRSVIPRAKLELPSQQEKITVKLSGTSIPTSKLVRAYQDMASDMGLRVNVNETKSEKDDTRFEVTITKVNGSPFPSDVFAFENGNHRFKYPDKGKSFTNAVRVEVVGIGTPPKPSDSQIRSYVLQGASPIVTDTRLKKEDSQSFSEGAFTEAFITVYEKLLDK